MNTEISTSLIDMTICALLLKLININKIMDHDDIAKNISDIQTNCCQSTINESINILNSLNSYYDNKDINNLVLTLEKIKHKL